MDKKDILEIDLNKQRDSFDLLYNRLLKEVLEKNLNQKETYINPFPCCITRPNIDYTTSFFGTTNWIPYCQIKDSLNVLNNEEKFASYILNMFEKFICPDHEQIIKFSGKWNKCSINGSINETTTVELNDEKYSSKHIILNNNNTKMSCSLCQKFGNHLLPLIKEHISTTNKVLETGHCIRCRYVVNIDSMEISYCDYCVLPRLPGGLYATFSLRRLNFLTIYFNLALDADFPIIEALVWTSYWEIVGGKWILDSDIKKIYKKF